MFASLLSQRLREALDQLAAAVPSAKALAVTPAADSRFGDYQSNAALMLAKGLRTNPRQLAAQLIEAIDVSDIAETPEIAGPGFINFRLRPEALAQGLESLAQDPACGVQKVANPQTIVIDFSAPNVAKPMHVGHIRSTFLGDALARIARFLGHRVIKDNHLGDWGTQFGMVLYGWKQALDRESLAQDPLAELLRLYRHVNALLQADESLRELCKAELVKLQAGDAENLSIWKECVAVSQGGLETIYQALEIRFDHWLGESFYNDRLPGLVEEFLAKGVATESEGAICIFSDREGPEEKDPFLIQREGEWQPNPAIIRKADGGFLYATTDLATIEYRIQEWKADEIWYVVGAPQQLHFRQVFSAASRAGWEFTGTHIAFGSILGQDRKLMKTRSGDNVQLQDVLDESIERARAIIEEKNPDLPADEKEEIARTVGLGAIK
ncbi:MAG: arginine--tRNA ligase, partial [Verrucomicrobiota bacterium]